MAIIWSTLSVACGYFYIGPTHPPTPQIPEYCHSLDEHDVLDNSFELIFAFDEIVALGYRESVNLAQIRTFTEMDSHEERVYEAMRKVRSQERKREREREKRRERIE